MVKKEPTIRGTSKPEPEEEQDAQPSILRMLITSFERSLLARDLSAHTLTTYLIAVRHFATFLEEHGMPEEPTSISREHVELYMAYVASTPVPKTGQLPRSQTLTLKYRVLKIFFGWLVDMDEIPRSPMERIVSPRLIETKRAVLTEKQIKAILKTCEGKSFLDRRDYAIIMLFIDTGVRLMEMASIELSDIDWAGQAITIRRGKGGKARTVYFGKRTLRALDQYVNLKGGRRDNKHAHLKYLWISYRGHLADTGIYEMLKGRGARAGYPEIHPHLWRHYFIHASLKAGAQVGDLMRQTGHTKVEMLLHYGEAAADERARESHRRLGPGDNL